MNQKCCLKGLLVMTLSLMIFSCSKKDELETFQPETYNVSGKVEKGPFVNGSTIVLQPMNAKMQMLGDTYISTIQDNIGNFTFGSKVFATPFAELSANGYFFNEVSGTLSLGTLNLKSVVDLSDKVTVNVNILTHLKYQRIINLVNQGNRFKEANKQAQEELFAAFGLSKYAEKDASLFSIVEGNDEAAVLIAVSSLFLVNRSEAEITEYLAKLCHEFGQHGTFLTETKKQIKEDREELISQLSNIRSNIISRYQDLGLSIEIKQLARFFDWNDDGVAGNEILQDGEQIVIEKTQIEIPNEGGFYQVEITSPVPVYLEPIVHEDEKPSIITPLSLKWYKNAQDQYMSVKKHLKDNILTIDIAPLNSRTEKTTNIHIYDCFGCILGTVNLIQMGDKNTAFPLLGEDAEAFVDDIVDAFAKGLSAYSLLEQCYHYNKQANLLEQYIYPSSQLVANCWNYLYKFNNLNLAFKDVDSKLLNVYQKIFDVFNAMQYYYMIVAWGDLPYITDYDRIHWDIERTSATNILNELKSSLKQAIEILDNKKNEPLKDINGLFFMSKDVARVLLANIYMYQNDYDNAMNLLDEVVKNGFYELDDSNFSEKETIENILNKKSGKELLFALNGNNQGMYTLNTDIQVPPLITLQTYTDVILSYAECLYKKGNISEAKKQLNKVIAAKNIIISDKSDVLTEITEVRRRLLLYSISNFAFMKRNSMAQEEYGVKDFRLLLPIPQTVITNSPIITQNQGY